jgi:hypothetical protein
MRTLYLPSAPRQTLFAEQIADALVQDNVRAERTSRTYAVVNAAVAELERALSLTALLDIRPWAADTRGAGSAVPVTDTDEPAVELDPTELIYGVPAGWRLVPLRSYPYDGSLGEVQSAAETARGLVVKTTDGELWLIDTAGDSTRLWPDQEGLGGIDGVSDWQLVSVDQDAIDGYARPEADRQVVSVRVEGFDLVVSTRALVDLTLGFDARATVADGQDLTTLPYYDEPGALYDAEGGRVPYTVTSGVVTFQNYPGGSAPPASALLHYRGTRSYTVQPPPGSRTETRVSFSDLATTLYRLPRATDVQAEVVLTPLCAVPGPGPDGRVVVDQTGFIGETPVGHAVAHVLPSEHHVVVGSGTQLSVVEHDTSAVVLSHTDPTLDLAGITWTPEGTLAVVGRGAGTLDLLRVDDVREGQAGGMRLPRLGDA